MNENGPRHRFDKLFSIVFLLVGLSALVSAAMTLTY